MHTYHIHIQGIVQGVGFRPFVYNYCKKKQLHGSVNNTTDGVHIYVNLSSKSREIFLSELIDNAPKLATITSVKIEETEKINFTDFTIDRSSNTGDAMVLLTPDFSICKDCVSELFDQTKKRYQYPFITCTQCGPRYSIIKHLPYDRHTTTMHPFEMCEKCQSEYNVPTDRRYFSQTNSCPSCKISMQLFEKDTLLDKDFTRLDFIVEQWRKGKIIAIKGIGGYLLTCDATNPQVITRLRTIKNRPTKPFALMYHDIYELGEDVEMGIGEKLELEEESAPIVLLSIKKDRMTPISLDEISPQLNTLGVMLPSTPLFKILLDKFKKPIIATSGNISNSTIIYKDKIKELSLLSDFVLSNNREIVIPQDDSIVRYSSIKSYRTVIRRSRGLAPSFIHSGLKLPGQSILAMGALLKSTFTLLDKKTIHISQYLGNTTTYEAQENYSKTLNHFDNIFRPALQVILTDKHPSYYTSLIGKEIATKKNIEHFEVQHHLAHFFAVMGENNLLTSKEKILGIIWDGTGLGDDGNIWGGEFSIYHNGKTQRVDHLDNFPFIVGDKMSKEPRISALVMLNNRSDSSPIRAKFTQTEWQIYHKLKETTLLQCSSIGRLFDAASSIILDIDKQSYEGEAAMKLENAAYRYFRANNFTRYYSYLEEEIPDNFTNYILESIIFDLSRGFEKDFVAAKFHITLAHYIHLVAKKQGIKKVCFSGGVFQNQWLIELILSFMDADFELYFHKELSPNDENISFGQLMYYLYSLDK